VHVLTCLSLGQTPTLSFAGSSVVRSHNLPVVSRESYKMDLLDFRNISYLPNSSIVRLCGDLNNIVGQRA